MMNKCLAVVSTLLLFLFAVPAAHSAVSVGVGFSTSDFSFLANYGSWTTVGRYGAVWRPHVIHTWRPFTYGHWIMTDNGWTWVSYEPYGWAVYHYGYWNYEPQVGWFWIPGRDWSAARVSWISYGDYVGWAPLAPPGVVLPEPWAVARVRYWNIVPYRSFTSEEVNRFVVLRAPRRPVSVTVVRREPDVHVVERLANRRIDVVRVNTTDVPAGKLTLRRVEFPAAVQARVAVHEPVVERDVIRIQKQETENGNEKEEKKVVHTKVKVKHRVKSHDQ